MSERFSLIGLDEPEAMAIRERLSSTVQAHPTLPRIVVKDGELLVQDAASPWYLPVSKVVYHGIFENDFDFLAGLALWGGPCLPNARAMMDCRLKLPCLIRALSFTRLGTMSRGYAAARATFETDSERVAKWGNWHCGENKARFDDSWTSDEPCLIEEFIAGEAVRVVMIGDRYWQIRLEGDGWLKSIHHANATFMEPDRKLVDDTRRVRDGFGLEIVANDYIVGADGSKHLLEVNHIPNVTRFPEIWDAYRDYVVDWLQG
jgi:hypothetical protein